MTERKPETLKERFIPRAVAWFLGLFGYKMLLLGFVKLQATGKGDEATISEMRLIRNQGTQKYPSDPVTTQLFASLMELQMNHLRELRAEQLARKSTAQPAPTTAVN